MTVLVKQKRDPGRQYVFDNVTMIQTIHSYNANNDCVDVDVRLLGKDGESYTECFNLEEWEVYKKFELGGLRSDE